LVRDLTLFSGRNLVGFASPAVFCEKFFLFCVALEEKILVLSCIRGKKFLFCARKQEYFLAIKVLFSENFFS